MAGSLLDTSVLDSGALQALESQRKRMDSVRGVLDRVGALLESKIHQRFDTKTNPDGNAWTPWSPITAKRRARESRGTLLEHSGHMRDSLSYTVGADFVEVGFGVAYAMSHETGTKNNPKRRLIANGYGELSANDLKGVMGLIEEHLNGR